MWTVRRARNKQGGKLQNTYTLEQGKITAGKVALGNGAYAVFTVDKVTEGDIAQMPAEEREGMRQQMAQLNGGIATQAYVDALRKRFKVKVFEERL